MNNPSGDNKRKIAFYAPLKSPLHPQPSGDRLIAQLLFKALQQAGFEVRLVSQFRSLDTRGDSERQRRMIRLGERLAKRLLRRWQAEHYQPDVFFCYHNYYKAPDLIGPTIVEQLRIRYWISEASWAQKRANGPWQQYHRALARSFQLASGCFVLNPTDQAGVQKALRPAARIIRLPVFLDLDAITPNTTETDSTQTTSTTPTKLVAVAMLRPGDKLHSLVILAQALKQITSPVQLHIVGDGKARRRAESLFIGLPVSFEGSLRGAALQSFVSRCDLMVWPAVNEAIGMALLEAQSYGVPVLAGREGGTASVVSHGTTGELVEPRNANAFAQALQRLLDNPEKLATYRANTRPYVAAKHGMSSATQVMHTALSAEQPALE